MDFGLTEEQQAVRDLSRRILGDLVTHERLKEVEEGDERIDRKAWSELAGANLLGIPIPEAQGGSGYGFLEVCVLLEEVGRFVAPVPVYPTLVLGALPLCEFGTAEQRAAWLPGVVRGQTLLSAALVEPGSEDPLPVRTTARLVDGTWILDGLKTCVPAAHVASRLLVPARVSPSEVAVLLVDPSAAGVTLERQETTTRELWSRMHLSEVRVGADALLGTPDRGEEIVRWIEERAIVGLCAMQVGVTERALRMTAEYTSARKQFDRPVGSFQAVHQRAGDAYIGVEGIRLTTWQAAWRLAIGRDPRGATEVAKFWAAEAGHDVTYAAQHLHGGIGVDVDYPLHRYTLWSKQIELSLGGASRQLRLLGERLAREGGDDRGV